MIDTDTGNQGDIGIHQIDRIQPTAQADLEHHRIQVRLAEQPERRQRAHFKIGQGNIDGTGVQLLQVSQPLGKGARGHAVAGSAAGDGKPINWASRRARRGRSSARWMIMSMAPCSIRNSLRWKPSGSFSRTVCSITRGPAKPIRALGSATITSPSMARLAETPP